MGGDFQVGSEALLLTGILIPSDINNQFPLS